MYKTNKSNSNKKHKGGVITSISPVSPVYINPLVKPVVRPFINPLINPLITPVYSDSDSYIVGNVVAPITPVVFRDPYVKPWVPSVTYPVQYNTLYDLNSDPLMRKKITKYFRNLMLDKWLYEESQDILNYLKANSDGTISFISNLAEYKPNNVEKDSKNTIENKIKFIEKYVLSYNTVLRLLSRYVNESTVSWVNLPKNKYFIRKLMEEKLYKMMKNAVTEHK